ncbi:AAA family ATPase [Endozoicomonas ascidiicola]|uniref:AAA family ATPase n=1 Tax=Endozoicomonas ascidiicola TaxID=1698521 RepID=UPI00082B19E9|nr:AAA family ATPase [Endozoicomonas ascidiicola]
MIDEIQINPPVATYQNLARLSDLCSVNYMFGANGVGKTTISRVIAQATGHGHCGLTWRGGVPLKCMVYNRDFVERNFNQDGPLQGVFTLGENQVDAEQEILSLHPDIERENNKISRLNIQLEGEDGQSGKRKELADLEPALRERCWKQKQLHDDHFQVAFSGVRSNADRFKARVLSEQSSNRAELRPLDELKVKATTIFSNSIERASLLGNLTADILKAIEGNELLQKVIIGSQDVAIAPLINHLGNSDWVRKGHEYHKGNRDICPFCQQSTDQELAASLSAFFNEDYDSDIQALEAMKRDYQYASEQLEAGIRRNVELNNPFLQDELYHAEAQALAERLQINQSKLTSKLDEPSRKVELEPIEPMIAQLQRLVAATNQATEQHNQTVANIASEKQVLISQVWRYVVNQLAADLQQYQQDREHLLGVINGMENGLNQASERRQNLKNRVAELEQQTSSSMPTITAINGLLKQFGFYSFSIDGADEGRHYRIVRANGDDASSSLSEGEKTFITFLYFYHLIKGAQFPAGITENRVVVFDDPISSLDSDILYIVSSLIKGVMDDVRNPNSQIKQVFILTHNVYFHKEISFNKSRQVNGSLSEESFWLVKKTQNGSVVERCETNPIRSAYELLWEDVKSQNVSSVNLQNTLRRILENYFTMWGGMSKNDICALFDGRDKLICQSLFSWVNDGSHSIHDDLYINHGDQTNESYLCVFREIFSRARQIGHYNMMTGSSSGSGETEGLPEASDTETALEATAIEGISSPGIRVETVEFSLPEAAS